MDNPQDTIVEEMEDIIINTDRDEQGKVMKHEGPGKKVIIVHSDGDKGFDWQESHSDGKQVIVVHSNGDDDISWQERHSGGEKVKHVDTKVMVFNTDADSVKVVKFIGSGDDEDQEIVSHSKKVVIRHSDDMESSRILWIIDGVQHTEQDAIKDLDPDKIQKMEVIKGEDMKKYTSEKYDGVIIVTSKKK